jgi:hypothetical protein
MDNQNNMSPHKSGGRHNTTNETEYMKEMVMKNQKGGNLNQGNFDPLNFGGVMPL